MKASEMFKALGFKKSKLSNSVKLVYFHNVKLTLDVFEVERRIEFYNVPKEFLGRYAEFGINGVKTQPLSISVDLLKAIQQQIKELGWEK